MAEVAQITNNLISRTITPNPHTFILHGIRYCDSRLVIPEITLFNGIKLLDVGCGDGKLVFELSKVLQKSELKAIDVNPRKIGVAEARLDDNSQIEFGVSDAAKLPFPDEYFDVVTCTNTFCKVEHKGRCLQEIFRVLKKSGHFYLLESIVSDSYKTKLDKIMRQSPFIKFSRTYLKKTALLARSYLITCQK
ncbi:methyltransferase domain-containing protein [candidate division KSB1 bacterium]|nr:methyltransferase domain-containing protein [candidate division KSB1 bacterium]